MIIKHLTKLTPAESLMILDTSNCSFKSLLKSTLMDLLLKKVLKTIQIEKKLSSGKTSVATYIIPGPNFDSYKALPHEMIFLHSFKKRKNIRILFRHLVKTAIEHSGGSRNYKKYFVLRTKALRDKFKGGFLRNLFNLIALNEDGKELQKSVLTEVEYLEKELPILVKTNEVKLKEIIDQVQGNIFILNTIDLGIFKALGPELTDAFRIHNRSQSIPFYFDDDIFDSEISDFESDSSGCSSDGCSGCSGCGGCGGD